MERQVILREGSELFDRAFYRTRNTEVEVSGLDELKHFTQLGWRQNRDPHPLFDARLYVQRASRTGYLRMNPLAHFILTGELRAISPTVKFDYDRYLAMNPDVAISAQNPFRHWLARATTDSPVENEPRPVSELIARIQHVRPVTSKQPTVDVVIPCYAGTMETLTCIESVLTSKNQTPYELVVIDDRSPEPELSNALRQLHETDHISLLANDTNLGFVGTVNRGMSLHPTRDVVLLNSDTEVYGDWLDRLRQAAESNRACATVTPLATVGGICSYPYFLGEVEESLETPPAQLDALARELNRGVQAVAPTGVGFCLYITRFALDEVGLFDAQAFGRGYGEENDFCQKAIRRGFVNVIAANTLVRHRSGVSFGSEKAARTRAAQKTVSQLHPRYNASVARFISADPLKPARQRIDIGRLQLEAKERNVLVVSHTRGGGTERHVRDEITRLEKEGYGVFRMRADFADSSRAIISHSRVNATPNIGALDVVTDRKSILSLLAALGITRVDVHHVADFGPHGATTVATLLAEADIPWTVSIHDYLAICPRMTLTNNDGLYCGEPKAGGCKRCLIARGSEYNTTNITDWRAQFAPLINGAREVVVPDQDVAQRLTRYFTGAHFVVRAHLPEPEPARQPPRPTPSAARPLRVGILGAISQHKGSELLIHCAQDAAQRELPLDFVVIGFTDNDARARGAGIEITGRYHDSEVTEVISDSVLDAFLFPGMVPETYSYTLTTAFSTGLPVFGMDIGAIGRRIREHDARRAIPLTWYQTPRRINDHLLALVGDKSRSVR